MTAFPLDLDAPDTHLMVLTGAGISAESGLSTYRDQNGLWEHHPVKEVATPWGFEADPGRAWRFWSERRAEAQRVDPNAGHRALVEPENRLGERFLLVTQNVDGLHQRAGSRRVVELHGSLLRSRCATCKQPAFADDALYQDGTIPPCDPPCRHDAPGLIRPDVVWFGEPIAQPDMDAVDRFMTRAAKGRFLFVAAGTSGTVTPASAFVEEAKKLGAESHVVNLEPAANAAYFDHQHLGRCGDLLPQLLATP
ncbi:MAG: NAD-dependent deacylase [Myxococcota bacterium]